MHWLCRRIEPSTTIIPLTLWNITEPPLPYDNLSADSIQDDAGSNQSNASIIPHDLADQWEFLDYQKLVFVPILCGFGVIGNLLNTIILSKKIREGMYDYGKIFGMLKNDDAL